MSSVYEKMFGKSYTVIFLTVPQIVENLHVDPEVQRDLNKAHARKFRDYVLTGLLEPASDIFVPALLATQREDNVLSLNDGQHRREGLKMAQDVIHGTMHSLAQKLQRKDKLDASVAEGFEEKRGQYARAQKRLAETKVPVLVFIGLDASKERQLFHDVNNRSKRPPTSLSLKYDNNDLYTYVTKQAVDTIPEFKDSIEWGAKLTGSNKFLFSNLFQIAVKFISKKKGALNYDNYDEREKELITYFETFFANTPAASDTNILGSSAVQLGIAMYANSVKEHADKGVDWITTIANTFKKFDWKPNNPILLNVGKFQLTEDGKLASRGTGATSSGVSNALKAVTEYIDLNGHQVSIDQTDGPQDGEGDESDPQIDQSQIPSNEGDAKAPSNNKGGKARGGKKGGKKDEATDATEASEPTESTKKGEEEKGKDEVASAKENDENPDPLEANEEFKITL